MIIYKSKILPLAVILGSVLVWFGFFALLGTKNISNAVTVILYLAVLLAAIVFVVSLTRIKISDDGILNYSEVGFIKKKVRISDITKIDRSPTYRGLSGFGYSMFIYYAEDGIQKAITIGENQFDKKTIKDLISVLQKCNPNIKFDDYYEKVSKVTVSQLKKIPKRLKIGFMGAGITGVLWFILLYFKDYISNAANLLYPFTIALMIFFGGWLATSRWKTGLKLVVGFVFFLVIIYLLSFIK